MYHIKRLGAGPEPLDAKFAIERSGSSLERMHIFLKLLGLVHTNQRRLQWVLITTRSSDFFLDPITEERGWAGDAFGGADFFSALALANAFVEQNAKDPKLREKLQKRLTQLFGTRNAKKVIYTVLGK